MKKQVGENSQIENVWRKLNSKLLLFITRRVSDPVLAEDILQDVFVKLQSSSASLAEIRNIESWVFQITRNTIIDFYRTRRMNLHSVDSWDDFADETEKSLKAEVAQCIEALTEYLPEKYQRAVRLCDLEGKTQNEFAAIEGISVSGAKSRVQRARKLLLEMMNECCSCVPDNTDEVLDCLADNDFCSKCRR